ncbi:MAG TPA: peptide ABC transporter substrate-binding protein [Synergistaceae bacterium]|nr:peptide ABC transporter substrate-binding protein [Synergistaceae bacterium]
MNKRLHAFLSSLCVTALLSLFLIASTMAYADVTDRYLVWNLGDEAKSWSPTTNTQTVADHMVKQLFEGLTVSSATGIVPGVAESWDVSSDGKTYTFHLRKNAKWSDGSPVTAKDFEYSWRRICDPKIASEALQSITDFVQGAKEYFEGTGSYEDIKATALDDYTFEVVLRNPAPFFPLRAAADVYCPVKKDVVEKYGEGWEKNPETCVGNGPFRMAEYHIGSHFIFEKNPYYWDADAVKLKGIKVVLISDANTSLQGYQAGEIDATDVLPSEQIPRLVAEDPNVILVPDTGSLFMNFNCDKPPFDDVNVRKAIAHAIDRKAIVEQVTKGGEIPACGYIAPHCLKTDGTMYRPLEDDGYPAIDEKYGIDPRGATVEKARAFLAEAGYPNGEGSPEVELTYANTEKYKRICEAIQQMLKTNLNITVVLRGEESSVFISTKTLGKYDMATGGWTNHPMDANGLVKLFHSQNGSNTAQWRWREYRGAPHDTVLNPGNKAFDEAFDKAMASVGEARDKAWREAEDALMEDMPITALYHPTAVMLINQEKVSGVEVTQSNSFMFKHAEIVE